jgi:hypothetical protein
MYRACNTEALRREGLGGIRRVLGIAPYPTSTSLPIPSCPSAPCPQHLSSRRVLREQVCLPPADSCVTTAVSWGYRTGTLRGGICPAASPTLRLLPYPSCPCRCTSRSSKSTATSLSLDPALAGRLCSVVFGEVSAAISAPRAQPPTPPHATRGQAGAATYLCPEPPALDFAAHQQRAAVRVTAHDLLGGRAQRHGRRGHGSVAAIVVQRVACAQLPRVAAAPAPHHTALKQSARVCAARRHLRWCAPLCFSSVIRPPVPWRTSHRLVVFDPDVLT